MAICDQCGNEHADTFQLIRHGRNWTFDSFECAIQAVAPECAHCSCKVIGHGVSSGGKIYCCDHCAKAMGQHRPAVRSATSSH